MPTTLQSLAERFKSGNDIEVERIYLTRDEFDSLLDERISLRASLLRCARMAEALKRDCGMEPEGAQAVRNAQYQAISTTAHIALGTIKGPDQ